MIGRIIGNYRVTGDLAQGGMGMVYRGHHTILPREVVVKSILLGAYSPAAQHQLKARFRREALIQSQLDHPNIVRVYEFFELEDNYFLVMEYVHGLSLHNLLQRESPLRTGLAVDLLRQALIALNHAHNFRYQDEFGVFHRGMIHRDVKPANFLLDTAGRLKISDFGIVKAIGEEGLTQSGFQPGTVEYMAPEQLLGNEVDERSDLYSLGVTFYEALTGRLPFPRSTTGSDWEVRKGHIEREPPSITELRGDIPNELAAILMRALRKDPRERYQSAAEMMVGLDEYRQSCETGELEIPVELLTPPGFETSLLPPESADPTLIMGVEDTGEGAEHDEATTLHFANSGGGEAGRVSYTTSIQKDEVAVAQEEGRWNGRTRLVRSVLAAIAGFLLLSGGIWLALGRHGAGGANQSSNNVAPVPSATPPPVLHGNPSPSGGRASMVAASNAPRSLASNLSPLRLARESEKREDYEKSISQYELYLEQNPSATDSGLIAEKLDNLRRLSGLFVVARAALDKERFALARQTYAEALKLNPQSAKARKGLDESIRRLNENGPKKGILRRITTFPRPLLSPWKRKEE